MKTFNADPRDGSQKYSSCSTCCCAAVGVRPGETDKYEIDYAEWAVPAMAQLVPRTRFAVETKEAERDPNAPTNTPYQVTTLEGVTFTGSVATSALEPNGLALSYSVVPFFEPEHGTVALLADGSYTYKPAGGFVGYDRFFVKTSSAGGDVVTEVAISVGPVTQPAAPLTPPIQINQRGVVIVGGFLLQFTVAVSPAVQVGDVFRVSVRQPARDCDCNEIFHTSCYDLQAGKC